MVKELIQIEDDLAGIRKLNAEENKRKAEIDKENTNDICVKPMEKLGETKRQKEDEVQFRKKRKEKGLMEMKLFSIYGKNKLMIKFEMEDKALEEQKQNKERETSMMSS